MSDIDIPPLGGVKQWYGMGKQAIFEQNVSISRKR